MIIYYIPQLPEPFLKQEKRKAAVVLVAVVFIGYGIRIGFSRI